MKEFDDWRKRYEAAIAEYEAMVERRRERKCERMSQARRDEQLSGDDEFERRYLETRQLSDPVGLYLSRREATSRLALEFLYWSASTTGHAVMTSVAARLVRKLATASINHAEKVLWRKQRNLALCNDPRSAAERERRKIRRRSTLSLRPSPDDFRRAWLEVGLSARGIIAFGALVHDLECYVDNSLGFDEYGNIVGRAAGVQGWLRENVPELSVRYKTIMRYKSIARRCRQYLGINDPQPLNPDDPRLVTLLADCPATQKDIRERLDAELNSKFPSKGFLRTQALVGVKTADFVQTAIDEI